MAVFRNLLLICLCPYLIQAHMEMSWPFPINSQLNPAVPIDLRDYSYTSPLLADGSNFPCKGYHLQSTSYNTTATYSAGGTYNMTIAGTVTHDGGSCQLSLSYDNGATFRVIKSMIGGCPISLTYDFTIPSFAPSSGSALLAWSWFNLIGNREMYMDCARIQIQGSSSQRRKASTRRQSSMSSLPNMFVCNVNNGCTTIEGQNVQFPDPGSNVVTGNDTTTVQPGDGYIGTPVTSGSNSTNNSTVISTVVSPSSSFGPFLNTSTTGLGSNFTTPPFANSSSSGLFVNATPASVISPSLSTTMTTSTLSSSVITLVARTTMTQMTLAVSGTVPSATMLGGPCASGNFVCNSPSSFSQCVGAADGSTSYIYVGSVANGMQCINGQIIRHDDGPCTPNGQLFCNGESMFYLCDQGGLINMGPVTPGTACVGGVIGYPQSQR